MGQKGAPMVFREGGCKNRPFGERLLQNIHFFCDGFSPFRRQKTDHSRNKKKKPPQKGRLKPSADERKAEGADGTGANLRMSAAERESGGGEVSRKGVSNPLNLLLLNPAISDCLVR